MKCINIVFFLFIVIGKCCGQWLHPEDICIEETTGTQGICVPKKDFFRMKCNIIGKSERNFQGCWYGSACCVRSYRRNVGDISLKKCQEYSTIERYKCSRARQLIVGGKQAHPLEFPHMAAIGYGSDISADDIWKCGGSLISPEFVLTAAHCVKSQNFGLAQYVKLGVNDLKDRRLNMQIINIVKHIKHPKYRAKTHENDIALLKLEQAARMNKYARPACLYTNPQTNRKRAIATGWGLTTYGGEYSQMLMKVHLDIYADKSCELHWMKQRSSYNPIVVDSRRQMCAGYFTDDEEKDTCHGDSGGPLQIYISYSDKHYDCNMYHVIGVTSVGKACNGHFGVYTRVSYYIKWIEDLVWPQFEN